MTDPANRRAAMLLAFETDAEMLVVHQLDLLAQIEAQLRAVHHTMLRIQRLRSAKHRDGPELSNGQRQTTLVGLCDEVEAIDKQIAEEHECCLFMLQTIAQMQHRLGEMKRAAVALDRGPDSGEPTP